MSRRAGWVKYCLGCIGVAVLISVVAGYFAYRWAANKIGQSFSMDPPKVAAEAAKMVPGAVAPPGYEGLMWMDLGGEVSMAMFGPKAKGAGENTMLMAMVVNSQGKSHEQIVREAAKAFQKGGNEQGETEVLASRPVQLTVGKVTTGGLEKDVRRKGVEELQYTALASKPGDEKRIVVLCCQGPKKGFDKTAMEEFLSKLQVTPISIDPGAATPAEAEESPEAAETPEATETPGDSES